MYIFRKNGTTSNLLRTMLRNSTTGAGLTGLTSASSGLVISTIADNEPTATAYTVAGSTIQTITTLGTFAAPSASNCRFKEVDATNHPGLYELQFADARFAVSNAKQLRISITGAASLLSKDITVQLTATDIADDAVHGGMSAIPNTACTTNASLLTSGTGTDQISVTTGRVDLGKALGTAVTLDANNVLNVSAKYWAGTAITATSIPVATAAGAAGGLIIAGSNAATTFATLTSTGAFTISGVSMISQTGDSYARIGAAGASLTAITGVTLAASQPGVTIPTVTTVGTTTNSTNAPTAGDFTATMKTSIGTAVAASAVASVTGNVGGNVVGSVGSVVAGVTVTTNNDKTGYSLTVTPPTAATIATAVLTTQMTESYRAAGVAPTLAQAQFEIVAGILDHSITGTTKTIRNIAGTAAKTYTLDSSTAPTSITETT